MTATTKETEQAGVQPKAKYHHGDLREALIAAAYQIVNESGPENFLVADACRLAGVSTAAPYRHFKDREEILAEVTARGFDEMTSDTMQAVEAHGEGTLDAIVAMGHAYVNFAVKRQGVFRLMFGQEGAVAEQEHVVEIGTNCFGYVIDQVAKYCTSNGLERDANEIAVRLWTLVHGASSLLIDGKYEKVAPDTDVEALIASATPALLGPTGP